MTATVTLAAVPSLEGTRNPLCEHPVGHVHGTRVCYVIDKCRCDACREAATAWGREYARRKARERWDPDSSPLVDTATVRAHIKKLQRAGMSWKRVAAAAGVPRSVLGYVLWGRTGRNKHRPTRKITRRNAEKILAVTMPSRNDLPDHHVIDGKLAQARLRFLVRLGWSVEQLASRMGRNRQALDPIINREHPTTIVKTARQVTLLYFELRDHPPTPRTATQKASVARMIARATAAGWPDPYDVRASH